MKRPPDWALEQVPGLEHGASAQRIERLAGGTVNEVFRVDSALGRFVLRLDGAAWRRPGVERRRELALHRAAAAAGIAPALHVAMPEAHGLLITEYVEGRLWTASDYADPGMLRRLGERLGALHRLTVSGIERFDPARVAQAYVAQVDGPRAAATAEVLRRLQALSAELGDGAVSTCVVHGDLYQGNLLQGSRLWLLDWEYAQVGDPLMDVACVLAYYPAAQPHRRELAAAAGLDADAQAGALAERVYAYRSLAWLWHLARGEHAEPP
ncbi:MAG TPA: phosphotransferase [Steroidobacteraceae bacterium]|jgi:thiamine kinase